MPFTTSLTSAWPCLRSEARPLAASAALGVLGVAVDLALPWPLAVGLDAVVQRHGRWGLGPGALLVAAAVALVVLTLASGLVGVAALLSGERAAERIGAQLRQVIFDRAMSLSPRWHDRTRSGELISRITTDVDRVLDAIVALGSTLLPDAVRVVLVLAVLFAYDANLALVGLAVLPVLLVFAVRQRRLIRMAQGDARSAAGRFSATTLDLVRNVRAVQVFGSGHGNATRRFATRNQALLTADLHAIATEAWWAPIADVVLAAGAGLVLIVGGRHVLQGGLSAGDLVVVTAYLTALYSPVRGLSRLSGVLAKCGASARRIDDVLSSPDHVAERADAVSVPSVTSEICFRGVRFGYDPTCPVLVDFDLTLRAGETVCLLGPSGAGKSTVLSLLLRLYDVDAGAVTIDGVDLRDMPLAGLRRQIAFVPQDPWLLDTSIAENIALGSPGATLLDAMIAGRDCLVHEFAYRLPHGYETLIGEGGATLSGGQRRRIALARAAVSEAPLILLDEPTASLDAASAAEVTAAIARSTSGRTVLVVTHDQHLAELADRVITLPRSGLPDFALSPPSLTGRR